MLPFPSAAKGWADGQVEIVTKKWRHGCFYHQSCRLQLLWPYRPHAAFLISQVIQSRSKTRAVNHKALLAASPHSLRVKARNPPLSESAEPGNVPLLMPLCYLQLSSAIFLCILPFQSGLLQSNYKENDSLITLTVSQGFFMLASLPTCNCVAKKTSVIIETFGNKKLLDFININEDKKKKVHHSDKHFNKKKQWKTLIRCVYV